MHPIPVELWTHIFRQLRRRDLVSLSRTCRTFHKITQVQLYRDVRLEQENDSILFARSVAEQPEFASLVFKLHNLEPTNFGLFTSFPVLHQISSFSNLRTLDMYLVRIDSGLCAALQDLPRLQEIRLEACTIDSHLDGPQTQMGWGRNLSTVNICPKGPADGWIAVIPPTIQTLDMFVLQGASVRGFSMKNLVTALTSRSQSFEFTTLILYFSHPIPANIIISLLIRCPQLKKITLQGAFSKDNTLFSALPSDSLPLLEHFSGNARHMEPFISGRRIHSVDIRMAHNDPDNTLISLRRSLIPVTKACLTADKINVECLRYIPPNLRSLQVRTSDRTGDTSWISALPRISTLLTLHIIRSTRADLSAERHAEFIDTVSATCNSLRELVFIWRESKTREVVFTRCAWRWRQELPWECYITNDEE